jgi:hypothetical protein
MCVHFSGIADVATFAIADGENALRNVLKGSLQVVPAALAMNFVEGEVELIGADKVGRGIDDPAVEVEDRVAVAAEEWWDVV